MSNTLVLYVNAILKFKEKLKTQDYSPYLLGLVLATLMLGYAISSIALGLFSSYALIKFKSGSVRAKRMVPLLLPVLLYFWYAITINWSIDQDLTLKGLGRTFGLLLPMVFIGLPKWNSSQVRMVLMTFTFSNVLFGIFFIATSTIRYFETNDSNEFAYHQLVSNLELNAIYVSFFFFMSFVFLLFKRSKSVSIHVLLIFFLIFIFLLSSKTIVGCTLLAIVIFSLSKISRTYYIRRKGVRFTLAIVVVALSIYASKPLVERINQEFKSDLEEVLLKDSFGEVYPWTGTSIRLLQLRILNEQINEDRILLKGYGLFASRLVLKEYHNKYKTYKTFHSYNYHNNYAQLIAESGIIGLLILIGTILSNLVLAYLNRNWFFVVVFIAFSVWFLTESVLWVQQGIFIFIISHCLFHQSNNRA